ncbi:MAG: VOC family protein [Candidatus Saccharimonadales bacterium]
MLRDAVAFSGFSVNDSKAALAFYKDTLGLDVTDSEGMGLTVTFSSGGSAFIYEKPDHVPATFTILNFSVEDIDAVVDELAAKGVKFEHYDSMPGAQDDKEIMRGKAANMGPDIAWFKDPAGNILAVLQN